VIYVVSKEIRLLIFPELLVFICVSLNDTVGSSNDVESNDYVNGNWKGRGNSGMP
jgi:hypothetical protein